MSGVIRGRPAARFAGPPADRMAGRPSRNAYKAKATAAKPAVSAATVARANSFMEREDLLDQAIYDGRINAGMRGYYAQCFDADPAGTRAFLGKMGHNPAASAPVAQPAPADDSYPESMLTNAERARVAAAREGRQPRRIVEGGC